MTRFADILGQVQAGGVIDLSGQSLILSLAELAQVQGAGASFTGGTVTLRDVAAGLAGLDAAALAATGVSSVLASDAALSLSPAQALAFARAGLQVGSLLDTMHATSPDIRLDATFVDMDYLFLTTLARPDGGWVTSWVNSDGLRLAQAFGADGQAQGGVVLLNPPGEPVFLEAGAAAMAADGSLLQVYAEGVSGTRSLILATMDADGTVARFPVATVESYSGTMALQLLDATTALLITNSNLGGTVQIAAVVIDLATRTAGPARVIDAGAATLYADSIKTTLLPGGGVAVLWTAHAYPRAEVRLEILAADGHATLSQVIGSTPSGSQTQGQLVQLEDRLVSAWIEDGDTVLLRSFDLTGAAMGGAVTIADGAHYVRDLALTRLADGSAVATWSEPYSDTKLWGRLMASDGSLGAAFEIDATPNSSAREMSVSALPGGGFVISWSEYLINNPVTDKAEIMARVYDAEGQALTGAFTVNTTAEGQQRAPSMVVLDNGDIAISWMNSDGYNGQQGTFTLRLTADRLGAEVMLSAAEFGGLGVADLVALSDAGVTALVFGGEALTLSGLRLAALGQMELRGAGSAVVIDSGAALAVLDLGDLAAHGITGLDASDDAVSLTLGQLASLRAEGLHFAAGDRITLQVAHLSDLDAQGHADAAALGVGSVVSAASTEVLTVAQAIALLASGLEITGGALTLQDTASELQRLTPAQIGELAGLGLEALAPTDIFIFQLSLGQALAYAVGGIELTNGALAAVSTSAAEFNAASPADLALLDGLPANSIFMVGGLETDLAHAYAVRGVPLLTWGGGLVVHATGAQLAGLPAAELASFQPMTIDLSDTATLTREQLAGLYAAGARFSAGDSLLLKVTAAELLTTSGHDFQDAFTLGARTLVTDDAALTLSVDQAQVFFANGVTLPSAPVIALGATLAELRSLASLGLGDLAAQGVDQLHLRDSAATVTALSFGDVASLALQHVTAIEVTGGTATLSLPRLMQLAGSGIGFSQASEVAVGLGVASLNPDTLDLGLLAGLHVDRIDLREDAVTLSMADAQAYAAAGIGFAAGDVVTLRLGLGDIGQPLPALAGLDHLQLSLTAAELRGLSLARIAALAAEGVESIDLQGDRGWVTAAQATGLAAAGITFSAEDQVRTLVPLRLVADRAQGSEHDTVQVAVLANDRATPGEAQVTGAEVTSGAGQVTLAADGTLAVRYLGADIDGPQSALVVVRYTVSDGSQTASSTLTLRFGAETEVITGTALAEVLTGGAFGERIEGLGGNDTLIGLGGADSLFGGEGNDRFDVASVAGADSIDGGAGTDLLRLDRTGSTLALTLSLADPDQVAVMEDGTSVVHVESLGYRGSAVMADVVTGGALADTIFGNRGDDRLAGGAGNDLLQGGSGADVLQGGAGADDLYGGAGGDLFVFASLEEMGRTRAQADEIFDFRSPAGDRIDLSQIDAQAGEAGDQAFAFIGASSFHRVAGELRFTTSAQGGQLAGDVDGDGQADFLILLQAGATLGLGDLVL